jgi:hypothetical protein
MLAEFGGELTDRIGALALVRKQLQRLTEANVELFDKFFC